MTAATRKASERARRKERGEVLVSAWLEPDVLAMLDKFAKPSGYTRGQAIRCAIWNIDMLSQPNEIYGETKK